MNELKRLKCKYSLSFRVYYYVSFSLKFAIALIWDERSCIAR